MGSNWVSEVSAGAGERVGGMVNGVSLTLGFIAEAGACEGGRTSGGRDLCQEWVGRALEVFGRWQEGLVRRSWIDGSNHIIPLDSTSVNLPYSTLASAALTISRQSFLFYYWRRSQCLGKSFSSISYQLSADPIKWTMLSRQVPSVSPIIFITSFQVFLIMLD